MKSKIIAGIALALTITTAVSCHVSTKANETTTVGKFYCEFEAKDDKGNVDTYYQFKSNDNEVWWMLTEEEIGAIPKENVEYALTYNTKGTTKENKTCGCAFLCECEVYDDEFISVKEVKGK